MIEVEIKAAVKHPDKVRLRLIKLGCVSSGKKLQSDTYYNSRDRDFAATDEALRIRKEGVDAVITYKGPRIGSDSKSRREIEVGVNDAAAAEDILIALGYTRVLCIVKSREIFRSGEHVLSLDEVEGLGHFLEIETFCETEDEVQEKVDRIIGILRDIGIGRDTTTTKSYLELLINKIR